MMDAKHETPEEKARRIGVPVIPKLPQFERRPFEINPTVAVCGECGLEIKQVSGYVCPRAGCPTGFGGPR